MDLVTYEPGPALVVLAVLCTYPIGGAVALSVGQAWAEFTRGWKPARYAVVWTVCTAALALPVLMFLGFPGEVASSHTNVARTAILLSALTTSAALGYARRRWSSSLQSPAFRGRVTHLFPIHLSVIVVLGLADLLILGVMFLGNIH